MPINPIHIKTFFNAGPRGHFFSMPQHHNVTRMANMPICIHLSNHILLNQFSLGNDEPGNVNNIKEMTNQAMAGIKEGFIFFNDIVSAILSQAHQIKNNSNKYVGLPALS